MTNINITTMHRDGEVQLCEIFAFLAHEKDRPSNKVFCLVPEAPTQVLILNESNDIVARDCKSDMPVGKFCDKWDFVLDEIYISADDFTISIEAREKR